MYDDTGPLRSIVTELLLPPQADTSMYNYSLNS